MRILLKIGKWVLIVVVTLLVLAVGGFLGLRAYLQHRNAPAFAINSANGINEAGYVKIGGIEQWVQIRGQDRNNPVLLCVHGGPGGTWIPITSLLLGWEKDFTVVLWDQRGAGKTLKASGASIAATMSIDRMAQDGIEVAEYLRTHLRQDKIILLGHSWGSILGTNMVKRRPELFHAYVGTGQVSDLPRSVALDYARLLEQARAAKDTTTLQALTDIGAPPFGNLPQAAVFFQSIGKYQPASDHMAMQAMQRSLTSPPPDYSLRDVFYQSQGFMRVPTWRLYSEMLDTKLAALGPDIGVPVFIFQGNEDPVTPAALAEEYFQTLNAPRKELVLLKGGGHFAVWSMADKFREELVNRVRPLAKRQ
jgi:pimeloyl-ACP methyl ester carboxylesterase